MRDPFSWSFPIGHVRGITIRVHVLLIVVFLGLYLRVAADHKLPQGIGLDQLLVLCLLSGAALAAVSFVPPFNPFWEPFSAVLTNWATGTEAAYAGPAEAYA